MAKTISGPEAEVNKLHRAWPMLHAELQAVRDLQVSLSQLSTRDWDLWLDKRCTDPYRLAAEMTTFLMNLTRVFYEGSANRRRVVRRRKGLLRLLAAEEAAVAGRKHMAFIAKAAYRFVNHRRELIEAYSNGNRVITDAIRDVSLAVCRVQSVAAS